MRKLKKTIDVSGRKISIGDTVTTINGDVTGKICDICQDADVTFVRVRPMHQSYGKGIWHAADRTQWLATAKPRTNPKVTVKPSPKRPGFNKTRVTSSKKR